MYKTLATMVAFFELYCLHVAWGSSCRASKLGQVRTMLSRQKYAQQLPVNCLWLNFAGPVGVLA
jgi:hypothetical protein